GDRVVGDAAPTAGNGAALPDLDCFHRLNAHERLREETVDAPIPVTMGPQPRWDPEAEDLDDPAERVAGLGGLFDFADHVVFGVAVVTTNLGAVDQFEVAGRGSPVG